MVFPLGALRLFTPTLCLVGALSAQSVHATSVVAIDTKGSAGGGIFNPANLLGAPDGAVNSLGIGGSVTLGFAVTIVDGPGADLLVTENAFYSGAPAFAFSEAVLVEVSSNGVDFARFPSAYYGPQAQPGPFGVTHVGWYSGLGGITPASFGSGIDPQDVVAAGGDAFDLADLKTHPLVVLGKVTLNAITQVRLVDVVSGLDLDGRGVPIFDPGAGSTDIDAVTVLHHTGNVAAAAPLVDLRIPADGNLVLTLSHPSGIASLDPGSLGIALYGIPLANPFDLLAALQLVAVTPTSFTLTLGGPLPQGFPLRLSVAVKDLAGHASGATRVRAL